MKKIVYLVISVVCIINSQAQVKNNSQKKKLKQISVTGGVDIAQKNNFSSYAPKNFNGFNVGIAYNHYFSWYGVGIDAGFYQNAAPVYQGDTALSSYLNTNWGIVNPTHYIVSTSSSKLTRGFIGIGPSFKYQTADNKLITELQLRGGVTYTKGSSLTYSTLASSAGLNPFLNRSGNTVTGLPAPENWGVFYHDGYTNDLLATAKAQLQVNYYFSDNWGVNAGVYYNYYFGSKALYNYLDWKAPGAPAYWNIKPSYGLSSLTSFGAFAGVSYRLSKKEQKVKAPAAEYSLSVLVKDELTGLPLNDADVTITDLQGNKSTAKTDAKGNAVFTKIKSGVYNVSGLLHDIATSTQTSDVNDSNKNAGVTLIHNDPRFTVKGKAINIGKNKPEAGVSVTLKDKSRSTVKMATTQSDGSFSFQLDGNTDYELAGKKANYISNIEQVSTKGLTRSQTLYVELELGVEQVEVGKAIVLQKIYYDLDKADIREDASTDLQKLIQFLIDNPTFRVEIASHTDSRGSDAYNMELSQKRAQAVVNYLAAHGIEKSRLTAKGYGETKLVNRCSNGVSCTEEEHQQNRRTEFTLISQ